MTKSRAKLAAYKILALREEFSEKEISEAITLIDGGTVSSISASVSIRSRKPGKSQSRNRDMSQTESRVVTDLRGKDDTRYHILREIDLSIRSGSLLPTMEDIRKVGKSIGKDFDAGKSKRDAIPRLMARLVELPVPRLEDFHKAWRNEGGSHPGSHSDYQDLAEFLIGGAGRLPPAGIAAHESNLE